MFTLQAGSSSWKRNLLMLSDLSPDLKKELDEQRKLHFILKKYLQLEEQVGLKIIMRLYWNQNQCQFKNRNNQDSMLTIFQRHMDCWNLPLLGTLLTGMYQNSGCFLFLMKMYQTPWYRIISAYEDKVLVNIRHEWFKRNLMISYKDNSFNSFVRLGELELITWII